MRKICLILSVLLSTVIGQINVEAQLQSDFSLRPYFSIEKNITAARLEYDYEFKKVDFKPVDIASAVVAFGYSKFMLSAALAAPWANGGDMGFSPYLDLSGGLDFADFSFYGGWISNLKGGDDTRKYNLINPYYFGIQARYERGMVLFIDDFQYRWDAGENNFNYSGFANTLRTFLPNKYFAPFLFITLEWWRGINDDKNVFFDNASFNIGLGLAQGKSTGGNAYGTRSNAMRSVGSQQEPPVVRKPNIYLYPEDPCSVIVKIQPRGEILKSIPEYGHGWEVLAYPDGSISGTEGFLFYEASIKIDTPPEGWCVSRGNIRSFFIDILSHYGFNEREIGDFIEYWEKILNGSPYYIIHPVMNEGVDNVCPLTISPEPDRILRLWFIIESAENPADLYEPAIPDFDRDGFVVTEWGGILID